MMYEWSGMPCVDTELHGSGWFRFKDVPIEIFSPSGCGVQTGSRAVIIQLCA